MSRAAARVAALTVDAWEIPHVLGGVLLRGAAARLARGLDRRWLDEAGWDPRMRVLLLPAQHPLLGRRVCRVDGCAANVHAGLPEVCHRCFTRLTRLGLRIPDIAAGAGLPPAPAPADRCAVGGCRCEPTVRQAVLCEPHVRQFRQRRPVMSMEQFLADIRVRPLPPCPACLVAACTRPADGACGYCNTHYQRWRTAQRTNPKLDRLRWQAIESGGIVIEG